MQSPRDSSRWPYPLSLLVVAAMALGLLQPTMPFLHRGIPDAARLAKVPGPLQQVEARLWLDPFEAIEEGSGTAQNAGAGKDESAVPPTGNSARRTLARTLDEVACYLQCRKLDRPVVVPVIVTGRAYAEDAENRRRLRYALLDALSAVELVPDDPKHLGLIDLGAGARNDWCTCGGCLPAKSPGAEHAGSSPFNAVPFELYVPSTDEPPKSPKASDRALRKPVLLFWLREEDFGLEPLCPLGCVTGRLQSAFKDSCVTYIGHFCSRTLESILREDSATAAEIPHLNGTRLFASFATLVAPDAFVEQQKELKCGLVIERTILGDDVIAQAILNELAWRGVSLSATGSILLVTEWDTPYGRGLRSAFHREIVEKNHGHLLCTDYRRGIDAGRPITDKETKDEPPRKAFPCFLCWNGSLLRSLLVPRTWITFAAAAWKFFESDRIPELAVGSERGVIAKRWEFSEATSKTNC